MPLAERHEVEIGVVGLRLSMLNEHAIGQAEVLFGPLHVVGEDEENAIQDVVRERRQRLRGNNEPSKTPKLDLLAG